MSIDMMATDRVCYVHCNFCNTILACQAKTKVMCTKSKKTLFVRVLTLKNLTVSVPSNSLLTVVTVRCGHCANLLSVNMGASLQTFPPQDHQSQKQHLSFEESSSSKEFGSSSSSSKCGKLAAFEPVEHEQPRIPPIRPPEKRQRVPSAYNRFIKEEIQRIKASNPDISHREAFSTAAKNWAHFPHIHFGLKLDGNNKQAN